MNRCFDVIPTPKYFDNRGESVFSPRTVCVLGKVNSVFKNAIAVLKSDLGIEYADKDTAELVVYIGEGEEWLSNADKALFDEKYAREQGYIIKSYSGKTRIISICATGAAYALMTLLQLYNNKIGDFTIRDCPDFKYRGTKWTLWAEAGCLSFDFGDGVDAMRERMCRYVDMMLKYKLNYVYADGFGFDADRFPKYAELIRTVSDYAKDRGIHLCTGGYAMSYGMVGHLNSLQGKHFENRKSYPDGEIYECIGTFDLGMNDNKVKGATHGTCLSNEALLELKLDEISEFVRRTHTGALYLHNMDADEIHPQLWQARCECCRKRWPSDSLFDKDGCAGAFAEFIDSITERLDKIVDGDYSASRDLIISIVSPGYLYAKRSTDEIFDTGVKFWRAVSEYLKYPERVAVTFREQFHYHDKPIHRINSIESSIRRTLTSVCNFSGGDGYYDDALFTLTAATNYIQKGVDANVIMNGNALQAPLAVFNAEYLWNAENSAFYNCERPENYEAFLTLYYDMLGSKIRPREVFGAGGMLEVICTKLYGDSIGKIMSEIYSLSGNGAEHPIATASNVGIYTNYSKVVYPMRWDNEMSNEEIEEKLSRFSESHRVTAAARALCEKALSYPNIDIKIRGDIEILCECFLMGEKLTLALLEYMKLYSALDSRFKCENSIGEDISSMLQNVGSLANDFADYVSKNAKETLDKFGGIYIRRAEMAEFLLYNTEIMERSIEENKRIPTRLKPLPTRQWW